MGSIHSLISQVKTLEKELAVCIRCGSCQSVCPLFKQTGREADVARGKLALLNGLASKIFSNPDGVNERLNRCLLCGSCASNCPSNVNVLDIFIKARAILTTYKGLPIFKKLLFRQMLTRPKLFNALMRWTSKFQGMMIKSNQNAQGTSCSNVVSPLLKNRHFLPLSKEPFHLSLAKKESEFIEGAPNVLFFSGCLIDKILPQIAHATVKVLRHHRMNVIIPSTQGCCGIPALASGDIKTFNRLVGYHLNLFKQYDFDYLVTACATCTSTIKKTWVKHYKPVFTQPDPGAIDSELDALVQKTYDINQFLVDVVKVKPRHETIQDEKTVTYHDPCHLKKSLGIFIQPRELIKISGYQIIEMKEPDKCCGMGGSFTLFHYDLSTQIGTIKQQNISDTQCSTVASGCPACMMQISDMLSKAGSEITVRHPVELYADALGD